MLKPKYTVYHSATLDANANVVWEEVRDMMHLLRIVFGNGIEKAKWVKGGSEKKVPSLFDFTLLPNHDVVHEEVIGRSESERSLTYRSVAQVLSIVDYVATYQVKPVTNDGGSFIEWAREFRLVEGTDADQFLPALEALFENELASVKAYFAKSP